MINEEAIKKIELLELEYEHNWGKKVDYNILPRGVSQEKLAVVLERIVNTGESVIVGWNKIYNEH